MQLFNLGYRPLRGSEVSLSAYPINGQLTRIFVQKRSPLRLASIHYK